MTTNPNPNPGLDRHGWKQLGASGRDACIVCGADAQVNVTLVANERTGVKGSQGQLVRQRVSFCDTHGKQRFAKALGALRDMRIIS